MEAEQKKRPLLPLQKIIDETYRLVWRYKAEYCRIVWFWVALAIVAVFLLNYCEQLFPIFKTMHHKGALKTQADINDALHSPFFLVSLLWGILQELVMLLCGVSVAVAWHRLILLKEQVNNPYSLRFSAVIWDYFLAAFIILLIRTAPMLIAIVIPLSGDMRLYGAVAGIAGFIASYYCVRLAVILPARALGLKHITFAQVLERTRFNFWRLLLGPFICVLPLILVAVLFTFNMRHVNGGAPLIQAFYTVFSMALFAPFYLTFLSLSFRHFFLEEEVKANF